MRNHDHPFWIHGREWMLNSAQRITVAIEILLDYFNISFFSFIWEQSLLCEQKGEADNAGSSPSIGQLNIQEGLTRNASLGWR